MLTKDQEREAAQSSFIAAQPGAGKSLMAQCLLDGSISYMKHRTYVLADPPESLEELKTYLTSFKEGVIPIFDNIDNRPLPWIWTLLTNARHHHHKVFLRTETLRRAQVHADIKPLTHPISGCLLNIRRSLNLDHTISDDEMLKRVIGPLPDRGVHTGTHINKVKLAQEDALRQVDPKAFFASLRNGLAMTQEINPDATLIDFVCWVKASRQAQETRLNMLLTDDDDRALFQAIRACEFSKPYDNFSLLQWTREHKERLARLGVVREVLNKNRWSVPACYHNCSLKI